MGSEMCIRDRTKGAPMGAQLIAGRYREDIMLDAAEAIEARATLSVLRRLSGPPHVDKSVAQR